MGSIINAGLALDSRGATGQEHTLAPTREGLHTEGERSEPVGVIKYLRGVASLQKAEKEKRGHGSFLRGQRVGSRLQTISRWVYGSLINILNLLPS